MLPRFFQAAGLTLAFSLLSFGQGTPGSTPGNPVLPNGTTGGRLSFFNPATGLWYDPPFAESYTYTITNAMFTQFAAPPAEFGFGALNFTDLTGPNSPFVVNPGVYYNITATSSFRLSAIPNFMIDFDSPTFASAFPVYLDWTGEATSLTIDVTPYSSSVPEPGTCVMLGIAASVAVMRKRLTRVS